MLENDAIGTGSGFGSGAGFSSGTGTGTGTGSGAGAGAGTGSGSGSGSGSGAGFWTVSVGCSELSLFSVTNVLLSQAVSPSRITSTVVATDMAGSDWLQRIVVIHCF